MGSRRSITPFNLAFLDIMFCGFGAVVLLVLIVQSNIVQHRREKFRDLQDEVDRASMTASVEEKLVADLQQKLAGKQQELTAVRAGIDRSEQSIANLQRLLAEKKLQEQEQRRRYEQGGKELAELGRKQENLPQPTAGGGNKIRSFAGEGKRQYLTGLKLSGRHIALLVDVSGSMLDETVVDILRRRNMSPAVQRSSWKWQQVLQTVSWITANMPADARLQIIAFHTKARQLGKEQWVSANDSRQVNHMLAELQAMIPAHGTSLINAFTSLNALNPRPDNCILLTDGLPTQDAKGSATGSVSAGKRLKLYEQAKKKLPPKIPVNTILFPMEGDPHAAKLFWQLAIETKGSFFTPTRDWP